MAIGLTFYASTLLPNLPTVEELRRIPLNIPLRIYSADQKLIAEYGNERRIPVTLDQVPSLLVDAILATEDDQFYHHTGVDFPGLVRAAMSNFANRSRGQGASTITMQVARNFYLNPEKTYVRKLTEILLAFNMERALTKDEILELYLNKIFLGHRAYGFAAAAQVYYGVQLENLSFPELAMLAGLPKAPSRDNPISNPKRAKERRAHVLKRLHELGKIDDFSLENAKKAPITARRHVAGVDFQAPYVSEMARQLLYQKFGDTLYEKGFNVTLTVNSEYQQKARQALRKGLLDYDRRHGYRGAVGKIDQQLLSPDNLSLLLERLDEFPNSGKITPAVVMDIAEQAFSAFTQTGVDITVDWDNIKWARKYIGPNSLGPQLTNVGQILTAGDIIYVREIGEDQWVLSQIPEVSGALVNLDSHTGAILALTGGFDYYLSKFNRATQAKRQPGSNIKPFIYSAALDHGFTPASRVSAAPIVVEDDLEGVWRPQNYSKKFFGPTRLRKAISLSLNLVSIRLLRALGIDNTVDHLSKFGFDSLPHNLSLALGSTAVTPLQLASSFAVLANGGKSISPYLIEKITDPEGNEVQLPASDHANKIQIKDEVVIEQIDAEPATTAGVQQGLGNVENRKARASLPRQVISPQNAFLTSNILKQVILTGTGRKALSLGRSDLAGKTGTTNDFKDAWFSGFNPQVNTTVFVGFDEPSHLGRRESGASAALPIWIDFMGLVLRDYPQQPEMIPENIITRFINRDTAEATFAEDPDGYTEYYLLGTEPNNWVGSSAGNVLNNQTETIDDKTVSESLF